MLVIAKKAVVEMGEPGLIVVEGREEHQWRKRE
jgi:hypothetical protein